MPQSTSVLIRSLQSNPDAFSDAIRGPGRGTDYANAVQNLHDILYPERIDDADSVAQALASCGLEAESHSTVAYWTTPWDCPSGYEVHKRIKLGVPSQAIDPLAVVFGVGKGEIADLLELDRSTAFRLSKERKQLPLHSAEGVFRLLELKALVSDTFEGNEGLQWLQRAHPMLEGETPLQAAKTSFGAQRVKDILNTIKYGGVV